MARTKFKARKAASKEAYLEKKEKRKHEGHEGRDVMGPPPKKRNKKGDMKGGKCEGKGKTGELLALLAPRPGREGDSVSGGGTARETTSTTAPATPTIPKNQNKKEAPSNDPSSTTSLPTPISALDEELSRTYTLTSISIISSTSIQKKATRALELLNAYPASETQAQKAKGEKAKENIVVLNAKAKVAGKMVSVVEIVKRDVGKEGGKWYQYNAVGSLEEVVKPKQPKLKSQAGGAGKKGVEGQNSGKGGEAVEGEGIDVDEEEEEGSEEESFEVMKTPFERAIEGKPRVRAVPTMTVYLSRVRIESLKKVYGEQTNGLEKKT